MSRTVRKIPDRPTDPRAAGVRGVRDRPTDYRPVGGGWGAEASLQGKLPKSAQGSAPPPAFRGFTKLTPRARSCLWRGPGAAALPTRLYRYINNASGPPCLLLECGECGTDRPTSGHLLCGRYGSDRPTRGGECGTSIADLVKPRNPVVTSHAGAAAWRALLEHRRQHRRTVK